MEQERVLVVDDERDILELIAYNLRKEGYTVDAVQSGEQALRSIHNDPPDAVILDLLLPGLDGIEVCRRIKQDKRFKQIPILMLTARTEDSDIVTGLEVGADDYITKPFSPKVLLARLRASLRRSSADDAPRETASRLQLHGITIDTARHEVRCGENAAPVSATEFAILEFLARSPGWVFSRTRIIDAIRGADYPVTERSVDVQILGLRRKLGEYGACIETVRGVGYRMREE
ncbi:MAG: DNA-binding response regulator [Spirochaetaceae bacterium]|nr:MAG: DNA-binding response regulator [Spirochaetaceae bacterium]